jgi:dihydroflavonol-4-reductase
VNRTPLTAAITGATGFIGRHVAAELASHGVAVTSIVRPGSRHAPPPGSKVVYAPLEAAALRDACSGIDAVIHLAGVVAAVYARTFRAVNTEGTRAVATAARDAGARLIHVSSLAAAGPAPASAPHREDDPPRPVTPYGVSKLDSERIVKGTEGLRWMILRPGVVYGPTDRAVFPLFQAAQRGFLPLVGRPGAAYTFIYIDDVVRTIVAAAEKSGAAGTVFVGHPAPVTGRDLLEAIQAAIGRKATVIAIPMPLTHAAAMAADLAGRIVGKPMPLNLSRYAELAAEGFVCSVDRMRDELGVTARVGLLEGMAKTAEWYRKAGWLPSA